MNENNPDRFESTVEYQFRNLQFLQEALTHSSFAQESADKPRDNEQMEFLGDAVLTFVVSVVLADAFPDWQEGKLTRAAPRTTSTEFQACISIRRGSTSIAGTV